MADNPSQSQVNVPTPPPYRNPLFDRWILLIEFVIFCVLAVVVLSITVAAAIWVIFGCWKGGFLRIRGVLSFVDEHWKISLLISIPLLYRPVRIFLQEVDSVFGMQKKKHTENGKATDNPESK